MFFWDNLKEWEAGFSARKNPDASKVNLSKGMKTRTPSVVIEMGQTRTERLLDKIVKSEGEDVIRKKCGPVGRTAV